MKLKEAYNSASALFTGITPPTSEYTEEIEQLVYSRWRNNDLVNVETEDDLAEWREWFEFITLTAWDVADKLLTSADLITDPLKTYSRTSTTSGTNTGTTSETNTGSGSETDSKTGSVTDTLKIETDGESADATSGYNNSNLDNTTKESDTPQSAVSNLTDGYLSKVTKADSENASNYLDASSHNKSETVQHSGGQSTTESGTVTTSDSRTRSGSESYADSHTTTESGYTVSQADLVKQYRETITNIRREVADLWHECFNLWYGIAL